MGTYYLNYVGGSRILNGSLVDQSGSDDTSVTDWDKTNPIVLAVTIYQSNVTKDPVASAVKLQWRNVTDSGSFADVAATGEVNYTATTDVVDGNTIATGKCTGPATWAINTSNSFQNESDATTPSINVGVAEFSECWFALSLSDAGDAKQYEFQLYDVTYSQVLGTAVAKVTTATSGTAHEKSLSDTVNLTDSISIVITVPKSDTINLTDNPSYASEFARSLSDTIDLTDGVSLVSLTIQNKRRSLTGIIGLTVIHPVPDGSINNLDRLQLTNLYSGIAITGGGAEHEKGLSDTVNLTDSISIVITIPKSDSISLSDNISYVSEYLRSLNDTVNLSDIILKAIELNKSDTVNLTDDESKESWKPLSDNINLSDNIFIVSEFVKSLTDTINLTDSALKELGKPLSDSITISDNVSYISEFLKSLSDTIDLTDDLAKAIGIDQSDTINMSDNFNAIIAMLLALNDTINLSDSVLKEIGANKSDTVNLTDSESKESGISFSDSTNLSDVLAKAVGISKSDTITLTDNFNAIITLLLSLSDSITMADSTTGKTITIAKSDTANLSDDLSYVSEFVRSLSDTVNLTDLISNGLGISFDDTITLTDDFSTATAAVTALYNWIAKDKKFSYNAETKTFSFTAGDKTFNFTAKTGP